MNGEHDWLRRVFLNSAPELIPASLEKVRRLNPRFIVPQPYDVLAPARHRRRFDTLLEKRAPRRAMRPRPVV